MWCFGGADRRMDRLITRGGRGLAYEYDIFLSYKRHAEARRWLVDHFQPLLEYYVELELGRRPTVFRDDQNMEAGTTWPAHLGQALGNSRVLVALWTKTYFYSDWCSRELSTMLARERDAQLRTAEQPDGLIVPVILHDCEPVPADLTHLQHVAIRDFFNPRMRHDSPLGEGLASRISASIAPGVAAAIEAAPQWRQGWPGATAEAFLAMVKRDGAPRQNKLPRWAP
jgi:hypothetical protein